MATFNYNRSVQTAKSLIAKFGREIKLIRNIKGDGPVYNPGNSKRIIYSVTAVVLPASNGTIEAFDNRLEGGSLIDERLRFVQMATNIIKLSDGGEDKITPHSGDYLIFDNEEWIVLGCTPLSPAGTPIVYRMGVKSLGAITMSDETLSFVPQTRKITAGDGLTGSGTLENDVTISLSQTSLDAIDLISNGGTQGPQGKPGNDGTNGIDGKDGVDGKSAYELFQEGGFTGTLEEWKASLKGEPGKDAQTSSNNGVSSKDFEALKNFTVSSDSLEGSYENNWNGAGGIPVNTYRAYIDQSSMFNNLQDIVISLSDSIWWLGQFNKNVVPYSYLGIKSEFNVETGEETRWYSAKDKIYSKNLQIKDLADATDDTDAVNLGQMKALISKALSELKNSQ